MSGNTAKILNKKKYHYTYLITNTLTNKKYFGVRSCDCEPEDDSYISSSKYVKNDIEEYGLKVFTKEVYETFKTREEANEAESKYLQEVDAKNNEEYYNLANNHTDFYFDYHSLTEEEKQANIDRLQKYANTPEAKEKSRQGVIKAWSERKEELVAKIHHKDRDYTVAIETLENNRGTGQSKATGDDRSEAQKEASRKRGEAMKGLKRSEKSKLKQSETLTGRKRPEHADTMTGRKYINNGSKTKSVKEDEVQEYLNNGWVLGVLNPAKGYQHKEQECPHCGKIGRGGNMKRYHFDNCKYKESEAV